MKSDRREASTALVGVGGLTILASTYNGWMGVASGFPFWASWAAFGIGPVVSLFGLTLLAIGLSIKAKQKDQL